MLAHTDTDISVPGIGIGINTRYRSNPITYTVDSLLMINKTVYDIKLHTVDFLEPMPCHIAKRFVGGGQAPNLELVQMSTAKVISYPSHPHLSHLFGNDLILML